MRDPARHVHGTARAAASGAAADLAVRVTAGTLCAKSTVRELTAEAVGLLPQHAVIIVALFIDGEEMLKMTRGSS